MNMLVVGCVRRLCSRSNLWSDAMMLEGKYSVAQVCASRGLVFRVVVSGWSLGSKSRSGRKSAHKLCSPKLFDDIGVSYAVDK